MKYLKFLYVFKTNVDVVSYKRSILIYVFKFIINLNKIKFENYNLYNL